MSNQIAKAFTIAYWIATVFLGASLVKYSARWLGIGWFAAALFFGVPLTVILWVVVLLERFAKFNVSRNLFAVVATVVPALYAGCLVVRGT